MTFIKGQKSWNSGKTNVYSEDTLEKMRVAKLHKVSSFKGKTHSSESKELIRKARAKQVNLGSTKGRVSPFKGKKHSDQVVEGMKDRARKQVNRVGPKGPWSENRRNAQKLVALRIKVVGSKPVVMRDGEYHPAWREIRKAIYKRDNWSCKCCGSHCGVEGKLKIQCHHIDYQRTNNDPSNLVTLCSSCHAKTNYDRLDWISFFKLKNNKIITN